MRTLIIAIVVSAGVDYFLKLVSVGNTTCPFEHDMISSFAYSMSWCHEMYSI